MISGVVAVQIIANSETKAGRVVGFVAIGVASTLYRFLPVKLVRADVGTAAGPRALLATDRATFRSQVLAVWLLLGLGLGFFVGLAAVFSGLGERVVLREYSDVYHFLVLTFLSLFPAGVLIIAIRVAWVPFALARCWLAIRRRLPWRLMAFLADAHEQRGVLRQAGGIYQFRHLELQRRLAQRHERLP